MKKVLLLSLALSLLVSPIANANMDKYFTDLEVENPQYNHIQWLARSGILQGYPDGSFRSGTCINRVEFLKVLYLTTQADLNTEGTNPFPDVDETQWYYPYVISAYNDGVVSGYGDGTFQPGNCVTKPEVLKMASEAYYSDEEINVGLQVGGFPISVNSDDWFFKYYNFAFPKNLAIYDAEFTINQPIGTQGATRGDVAETLWRFQALQDSDSLIFDTSVSAPREIFQEYMGIDEMLSFYFPADWEVAEDYFYETAAGEASEMATITLEHRISMDIISINERQVQCDGEFSATCLETDLGYTISSFDPSPATLKAMQKIQSTLTYESAEFVSSVEPTHFFTISTNFGDMKFELYGTETPELTKNITELSNQKKYEGVKFHRVIKDFVIQAGDFENNDGTGGHSYLGEGTGLADEYHPDLTHTYGALAMAKPNFPNSIGSQFYIVNNQEGAFYLDQQYSVIGQLIEGFDTLEKISNQEVTQINGGELSSPVNPIVINSTQVEVL